MYTFCFILHQQEAGFFSFLPSFCEKVYIFVADKGIANRKWRNFGTITTVKPGAPIS